MMMLPPRLPMARHASACFDIFLSCRAIAVFAPRYASWRCFISPLAFFDIFD
jgi:hypothetical protein